MAAKAWKNSVWAEGMRIEFISHFGADFSASGVMIWFPAVVVGREKLIEMWVLIYLPSRTLLRTIGIDSQNTIPTILILPKH